MPAANHSRKSTFHCGLFCGSPQGAHTQVIRTWLVSNSYVWRRFQCVFTRLRLCDWLRMLKYLLLHFPQLLSATQIVSTPQASKALSCPISIILMISFCYEGSFFVALCFSPFGAFLLFLFLAILLESSADEVFLLQHCRGRQGKTSQTL